MACLHVSLLLTACVYNVFTMYNVFTVYLQCIYNLFKMCLQCIYKVFTMCLQCVYNVFTMCLQFHHVYNRPKHTLDLLDACNGCNISQLQTITI